MQIKVRQQVYIGRPAASIFAYVSDLEQMTGWSSALVAVQKLTPEIIGPGTLVQSTLHVCERKLEMIFEVVEYESDRYLALKSIAGHTPCFFSYRCQPVVEGGTTLSAELALQWIEEDPALKEETISRTLRHQLAYDLRTLRDALSENI
jgi:hypothetical protein